MDKQLEDKLCREFPLLYRDRFESDPRKSLMCFGFACGDGWFDVIHDLSVKLERIIERMQIEGCSYEDLPRAIQVKEKFGTLRFYVDGDQTREMMEHIDDAERSSSAICDVCGAEGRLQDIRANESGRYAWWATRCSEHVKS